MNGKHAGCRQKGACGHLLAVLLVLAVALCALCPGTARAEEQTTEAKIDDTLQVSITFDKESYAAGEKVHAVVTGTNASNEPLRDVNISVALPEGYHASDATQKTVAKMAAGSSQTLDVYLERDAAPTPDPAAGKDSADSNAAANGSNADSNAGGNTANGSANQTQTAATTTKTTLASTADPSMSVALLCVEGLIAVAAGIVVVRRGRREGSTYIILICTVALSAGIVAAPVTIARAEAETGTITPSIYDYGVKASATADATHDGKPVTLAATMSGHKRHLPATANLHVMHINDIHGYYKNDSYNKAIGFSALKALKDQQKPDLLLDAGDTFHGQSFATVFKGESIAILMDEVGVDATTPGNHDWSYGDARLQEIDADHAFSILGANITDKYGNAYFKNDYLVRDVTSDEGTSVRVGVFGVMDPSFDKTTPASNLANVTISDAVECANEMAATLRDEHDCDLVIALTHYDSPEQLIAQTSGLDAAISGHQHVLVNNTTAGDGLVKDRDGHGVALVEARCFFGLIGTLDLTLNNTDGNGTWDSVDSSEKLVDYDAGSKLSDPTTDELIETVEGYKQAILNEHIGESSKDYDYPFRNTNAKTLDEFKLSWEWLRTRDEPIGHVVTASYLAATGADLAIENAGGIRGGIPKGEVKYQDVLSISPYGNTLETRKLTGAQLREVMEHSMSIMVENRKAYNLQNNYVIDQVAQGKDPSQAYEEAMNLYKWPNNSGSVLVLGGARLTVDWTAQEGNRIKKFELVRGGELDDSATYTVAMNNYVGGGEGGEYGTIASAGLEKDWGTCEMVLRDFIASEGWETRMVELTGETALVDA